MTNEYIAIDFETTGLDPKHCEVVEIGAVRFREDGEILDTFQSLAKPKEGIPPDVQRIHGITNDMVENSPSPRVAWDSFITWAGDFSALVAHNAQFEALFIKELYLRDEMMPDMKIIDTLHLSKRRLDSEPSHRLSDLVKGTDGHRALPDAHACVNLFMRVAKTYKSGKVPHGTYLLSVASYLYVDPSAPSDRQLAYIESLGGNPGQVSTKKAASNYIDRLKKGKNQAPTPSAWPSEETDSESAFSPVVKVWLFIGGLVAILVCIEILR